MMKLAVVSPRSSFVRLYEATRTIPYFPLPPSTQLTLEPVATARVSPRIVPPQQQQQQQRSRKHRLHISPEFLFIKIIIKKK